MSRPRLLDLFCGAGGATKGYQDAGFHVVGVDIEPQPNFCGDEFYQADAMTFPLDGFDAIHASPVCYAWSKMRDCRPETKVDQPDLITPLRPLLEATGLSYVIENVPGSPLRNPVQVCGSGLGMTLQRHRWFESNIALWGVPCAHGQNAWNPAYGHATGRKRRRVPVIGEWRIRPELQHEAMGIDWMTLPELTEAIPPAYTQWIGSQLIVALEARPVVVTGAGDTPPSSHPHIACAGEPLDLQGAERVVGTGPGHGARPAPTPPPAGHR